MNTYASGDLEDRRPKRLPEWVVVLLGMAALVVVLGIVAAPFVRIERVVPHTKATR